MAEEFARWFLAAFFSSVAIFYIVRVTLLSRRLGQPVTYMGEPGSLHRLTHRTFRGFRLAIFLICLARVPLPEIDNILVPVEALWHPGVILTGCAILLLSFAGIVAVNLYMRAEWRSGTQPGESGHLIRTGPYALSQNPMMILVMLGQLGFFLALPSLFTAICLVVGVCTVIAQTGVERRSLLERFGDEYRRYAAETPRWLLR